MDSKLARAIDDHVTGRFHPDAPFNQRDPDPKWECPRCGWAGDDATETEFRTVSEFWGAKQNHISYEYTCPQITNGRLCGHEVLEFERPADDEEEDEEYDDEDEDDLDDDELEDDE